MALAKTGYNGSTTVRYAICGWEDATMGSRENSMEGSGLWMFSQNFQLRCRAWLTLLEQPTSPHPGLSFSPT